MDNTTGIEKILAKVDGLVKSSNTKYDNLPEPWRFLIPVGITTFALGMVGGFMGYFILFLAFVWRFAPIISDHL